MLWAYSQLLDPLAGEIFWSPIWSTFLAALPVIVLFWLLVPRRWLAPKAGAAGAVAAILVAILIYSMPPDMALWSFAYGAGFGLLPVGWTIFNAMLLYNITVETGQFTVVRRSVAELSGDARIQAVLIGFSFGAFLEGAAGGGTPVAICGAIMVGLGFNPFLAAVLCLIANTSPVAYGGLGTPLIVLNGVTDLPTEKLSTMAGHQLPFLSLIVPLWMVKCMCSWKQTLEIWPALAVSGGSFAIFQYFFATMHDHIPGVVLYPMTDIGGGIFSLIVTAIFLRFWKPPTEFRFDQPEAAAKTSEQAAKVAADPHAAEAAALVGPSEPLTKDETPLTGGRIALAWAPFALMSVFLMLTGIVRQKEGEAWFKVSDTALENFQKDGVPENVRTAAATLKDQLFVTKEPFLEAIEKVLPAEDFKKYKKNLLARSEVGVTPGDGRVAIPGTGLTTNYQIAVPTLHKTVYRDKTLIEEGKEEKPEGALFNFAWLTAPGTAVFFAALASMVLLRMNRQQIGRVFVRTCIQMKIPIPTIAFMLGLSYVTRYAGMDATLGYAFAETGLLYPFFAAILGWLGVFLTGTDAGSNALFGSLQKITATQIYGDHPALFAANGLDREQLQVLICTANSTGGVMGKMIDAQSICVATAATHQIGKEADIFKAVIWHSIVLASLVGLITLLQAYVFPFTRMVPP